MINKTSSSQSGFALLEVLLASTIMALAVTATISALVYFYKSERRFRTLVREDQVVASVMANIRANLDQYQQSFDAIAANGSPPPSAFNDFPIAFSNQTFTSTDECPDCPGKLGFVISPIQNSEGLYKVTLRIQHKELYGSSSAGTPNSRDYVFVATYQ